MPQWSEAACAGASSFGMSGTNAYAAVLTPQEPAATAANDTLFTVWERFRWDICNQYRILHPDRFISMELTWWCSCGAWPTIRPRLTMKRIPQILARAHLLPASPEVRGGCTKDDAVPPVAVTPGEAYMTQNETHACKYARTGRPPPP